MLSLVTESTDTIDILRVKREVTMIDDVDNVLRFFDPDLGYRGSLLSPDGDLRAHCASEIQKKGDNAAKLFGNLTFFQISLKNNVLDTVSRNGAAVVANVDLIGKLDRYADEVARFDVLCPKLLGAGDVAPDLKARFLDSVGGYWEAKGENFGVSDNDQDRRNKIELRSADTIKALCKARIAYAQAGRTLAEPTEKPTAEEGLDRLDLELSIYDKSTDPIQYQAGWDRADAALSNYPKKDVDDACK